jgi:hypothetical protein
MLLTRTAMLFIVHIQTNALNYQIWHLFLHCHRPDVIANICIEHLHDSFVFEYFIIEWTSLTVSIYMRDRMTQHFFPLVCHWKALSACRRKE